MSTNVSNIISWVRDIAPSHYVLNVESFSDLTEMLSKRSTGNQFYNSQIFEASGYKWTLSMYPNGVDEDSKGHISLLLCIEGTDKLPKEWEIYTDLKFFIFDQKHDKYSVFQDVGTNRFHRLKPECGIRKLVSRVVFDNAVNSYLVNNKCAFGVEVFVVDSKFKGECLKPPMKVDKTFTWKVSGYSNLGSGVCYSNKFTACSYRWRLTLYPLGDNKSLKQNLSLFLELVDQKITCTRLLVHYTLCIKDQNSGKHIERECCTCHALLPGRSIWGWSEFVSLADVQNKAKGFLVNNCIVLEARIMKVSCVNSQ